MVSTIDNHSVSSEGLPLEPLTTMSTSLKCSFMPAVLARFSADSFISPLLCVPLNKYSNLSLLNSFCGSPSLMSCAGVTLISASGCRGKSAGDTLAGAGGPEGACINSVRLSDTARWAVVNCGVVFFKDSHALGFGHSVLGCSPLHVWQMWLKPQFASQAVPLLKA